MKRIILTFSALLLIGFTVNAQYHYIVQNDPSGDAGMMGLDVRNLSYELSMNQKDITFKFEMHNAVNSWDYSGFLIYVDEDLNPSMGITPQGANKSMKADRLLMVMNMMGMWSTSVTATDTTKSGDISSLVTISSPDNKTILIKVPLNKVDSDGDGHFNLLVCSAVAGSSTFYIDDVPNSGYSTMNLLSPTNIKSLPATGIAVSVYPNPAANVMTLSSVEGLEGIFHIYDMTGKEVGKFVVDGKVTTIPVQNLSNGIYTYRLRSNKTDLITNGKFNILH